MSNVSILLNWVCNKSQLHSLQDGYVATKYCRLFLDAVRNANCIVSITSFLWNAYVLTIFSILTLFDRKCFLESENNIYFHLISNKSYRRCNETILFVSQIKGCDISSRAFAIWSLVASNNIKYSYAIFLISK